jgi:hypothetical protein
LPRSIYAVEKYPAEKKELKREKRGLGAVGQLFRAAVFFDRASPGLSFYF